MIYLLTFRSRSISEFSSSEFDSDWDKAGLLGLLPLFHSSVSDFSDADEEEEPKIGAKSAGEAIVWTPLNVETK